MTQDLDLAPDEQSEEQTPEDRSAAYKEAAIEVGKGIAMGLVPFLGQAIDAYDTVESAIVLYNAKTDEQKEDAQFDFLLALVGWIPGPGDGVKKSLRVVNKDPRRFAPVLFDILTFVLQECGIKTSPWLLLEAVFDAERLRSQFDEVKKAVNDSSVYQALPDAVQKAVMGVLIMSSTAMPAMLAIVQKRLKKWKALQYNSSAHGSTHGRARRPIPGVHDGVTSSKGDSRGIKTHANSSVAGTLASQAIPENTNEVVGISGEHIADYMCAYHPAFGWGKDWSVHDSGGQGHWTEGTPSRTKQGKLSAGGKPKEPHVLYKLSDGANGTGLDGVWRAERNNHGKPYAIVEAKASRNEDAPKFNRKPSTPAGMLGVVVKGEIPITDLVQVIEPIEEEDDKSASATKTVSKGDKKKGGKSGKIGPTKKPESISASEGHRKVMVQMSHEWIKENMEKAVGRLRDDVLGRGYSRHLFYSPRYHPSGSPDNHFRAKQEGLPDKDHAMHDAFHYDEHAVKAAVNKRKAALRKRHGNLVSLKEEL